MIKLSKALEVVIANLLNKSNKLFGNNFLNGDLCALASIKITQVSHQNFKKLSNKQNSRHFGGAWNIFCFQLQLFSPAYPLDLGTVPPPRDISHCPEQSHLGSSDTEFHSFKTPDPAAIFTAVCVGGCRPLFSSPKLHVGRTWVHFRSLLLSQCQPVIEHNRCSISIHQ